MTASVEAPPGGGRFFIWAHRGASADAPENTLAAFREAQAQGAHGIELDVHLSGDGIPVVMHDDTLERTSDGRGRVCDFSLRELQRLDAGSWFSREFAGERIPSLAEVLSWADDRMRLNLELKTRPAGEAVLSLLAEFPRCRVLVSSFNHALLAFLRAKSPTLPLGFLCDSRAWRLALARAERAGAESFHPRQNLVSRPLVKRCRQGGLSVYPWTVDDLERGCRLRRLGVAGIFTNVPGAFRTAQADKEGLPF